MKWLRFAASEMGKVGEFTEAMRKTLEGLGADFIDLVSYGNGKGVVIAKYPDENNQDTHTSLLGSDAETRLRIYRALVAEVATVGHLSEIRTTVQQQKALGDARFRRQMERMLGRCMDVRPAHRPPGSTPINGL